MKSSKNGSSAEYIKRNAKHIKKTQGVSHSEALDKAAQASGFSNWKHFRNMAVNKTNARNVSSKKPMADVVSYKFVIGPESKRPNTKMPVEDHKKVSIMLNELIEMKGMPKRVSKPLEIVRHDLDDWLMLEHPNLAHHEFHDMYYASSRTSFYKFAVSYSNVETYVKSIQRIREIVTTGYHDCEPLRELVRQLEKAMLALIRWRQNFIYGKKIKSIPSHPYIGSIVKVDHEIGIVTEYDTARNRVSVHVDKAVYTYSPEDISFIKSKKGTFRPMRLMLPYGKWIFADGREILFNRDYKAIWQKKPSGEIAQIDPEDRGQSKSNVEYFFNDSNPPWKNEETEKKCTDVLSAWRVLSKPSKVLEEFEIGLLKKAII